MIGLISGILLEKQPPHLLVDVQGIGYELEAPMSTFYQLPECGQKTTLYTHFAVREDAHILYGFSRTVERSLFRTLLKVNGVGSKLALAILSGMDVDGFKACILAGDADSLVRLPGVGKKTAERLVVELRDRINNVETTMTLASSTDDAVQSGSKRSVTSEAVAALVALGYKMPEAQKMVKTVQVADASCEDLIRLALKKSLRQ